MATSTQALPFKPNPSKSESKADATTSAARSIMADEENSREAKTARLRAARLKAEAAAAAEEKPAKPRRTTAKTAKRSRQT